MNIFIITGTSGSGKSVAIRALEDAGFDCVDNLPVQLIENLVNGIDVKQNNRLAIAIDGRQGASVQVLPSIITKLKQDHEVTVLFLDATTSALVNRFSETRRRHPLSSQLHDNSENSLIEAINLERKLLVDLDRIGHHIDTSHLSANTLRTWVQDLIHDAEKRLTLLFQSFGYKNGVPQDIDLLFDARCIPNPYYEKPLRHLTGNDAPVKEFLHHQEDFISLQQDIFQFVKKWLHKYQTDGRSYLTIGIGCTGGQHRSVAMVNDLYDLVFNHPICAQVHLLKRHRELDKSSHSKK
jgi:RNase adapter protein RapZ